MDIEFRINNSTIRVVNGWITVHPNGENAKGRHLHIDEGEDLQAALSRKFGVKGDKFRGVKPSSLPLEQLQVKHSRTPKNGKRTPQTPQYKPLEAQLEIKARDPQKISYAKNAINEGLKAFKVPEFPNWSDRVKWTKDKIVKDRNARDTAYNIAFNLYTLYKNGKNIPSNSALELYVEQIDDASSLYEAQIDMADAGHRMGEGYGTATKTYAWSSSFPAWFQQGGYGSKEKFEQLLRNASPVKGKFSDYFSMLFSSAYDSNVQDDVLATILSVIPKTLAGQKEAEIDLAETHLDVLGEGSEPTAGDDDDIPF